MTDEWKPEAPAAGAAGPAPPPPSDGRGGRSRRFVIAGLAIAGVLVLLVVGGIVLAAMGGADRGSDGQIESAGDLDIFDVRPGDCLNDIEALEESFTVQAVPCGDPHDAEAFTTFDLPESDWPGEKLVVDDAERGCDRRFPKGRDARDAELFVLHPTEESWDARDDRTVVCLALFSPPRQGSLR